MMLRKENSDRKCWKVRRLVRGIKYYCSVSINKTYGQSSETIVFNHSETSAAGKSQLLDLKNQRRKCMQPQSQISPESEAAFWNHSLFENWSKGSHNLQIENLLNFHYPYLDTGRKKRFVQAKKTEWTPRLFALRWCSSHEKESIAFMLLSLVLQKNQVDLSLIYFNVWRSLPRWADERRFPQHNYMIDETPCRRKTISTLHPESETLRGQA